MFVEFFGNNKLAQIMISTLCEHKKLIAMIDPDFYTATSGVGVSLQQATKQKNEIEYHPVEVVLWKLGLVFHAIGGENNKKKGRDYLRQACALCDLDASYLTMKITGLGIRADLLYILKNEGMEKEFGEERDKEFNNIKRLLRKPLDNGTEQFIINIREKFNNKDYKGLADMITY